jgi:hypothetical protein
MTCKHHCYLVLSAGDMLYTFLYVKKPSIIMLKLLGATVQYSGNQVPMIHAPLLDDGQVQKLIRPE